MTRTNVARALLAWWAVALIVGCAPRVIGEITAATPLVDVVAPRFVVDAYRTRIDRFDPPGAGAGLVVTLIAEVANPNPFDLRIERLAYTLQLAGSAVASGVLTPDLAVPRLGSTHIEWTVEASLADRPELWRAVLGTYAGVPLAFEVLGEMRFLSEVYAFTTGSRPLFGGELSARESIRPPTLALVAGRHEAIVARPDAPALRLALEVTNPGDVGYFVSARGLQVALLPPLAPATGAAPASGAGPLVTPSPGQLAEGLVVGTVDLSPLPVPAGSTVRTDLIVVLDPASLPAAARSRLEALLEGRALPFIIDGRFAYDVLGVDSFEWRLAKPLYGVVGGSPAAR